jgi:hypothetical protein
MSWQRARRTLNINHSAGFSKIDGVLKYNEAKTMTAWQLPRLLPEQENRNSADCQDTGTVSIKESTPIALGATPCTRPTPMR